MIGIIRSALLLTAMLLASCSSDQPLDSGSSITTGGDVEQGVVLRILSGSGQIGLQFESLSSPVVIRVESEDGVPLSGTTVRAVPESGSGSVSATEQVTDADGNASFEWTLGAAYTNQLTIHHGNESTVAIAIAQFHYFPPSDNADGWPTGAVDPSSSGSARMFEGVDLIRRNAFSGIHSLVVAKSGEIVLETYFEGKDSRGRNWNWGRNTPHEQQSASKSFRSALVGIAVDKGLLSLDTPVADFFPDQAQHFVQGKERMTVQDFLTMSSGLEWDESGAAAGLSNNNLSFMYSQPRSTWTDYVFSRPLAYTPGTHFVYNTAASLLLDDMVVAASGSTLKDFVYSNYYDLIESQNTPGSAPENGAAKTPREMAKLGQIYLTRGMWKNTRVLSQSWVEDSFVERMTPSTGTGYGYQWWMRTLTTDEASYRVRYASGNGGQFIMVIDELDLVVVSTGGNFGSSAMNQFFTIVESYVLPAFE